MSLPGINPKRVKMQFKRKAQEQQPFSNATAIGGKIKQKKILHMSRQVTVMIFKGLKPRLLILRLFTVMFYE